MNYSAILFDFDYTLADASEGIYQSYAFAFNRMGLPKPNRDSVLHTIGMTLPDGYTYLTGDTDPVRCQEFRAGFVIMADRVMVAETRLLPGAERLLDALYEKSVPVGIVSTKLSRRIDDFFALAGKSDRIGCVVGLDRVSSPKPDPEGIRLAISLLGVESHGVLYVGDTVIDALTAQNAGVDFAAVLTGVTNREVISAFPSVYIARDLLSLHQWLFGDCNVSSDHFRGATAADLADVERLVKKVIRKLTAAGIGQWDDGYPTTEHFKEDIQRGALRLLFRDGRLIAMAALDEFQPPEYREVGWAFRNERICVFHRLCVEPEYQKSGIGRSMLLRMEELARSKGYGAVRLDAFSLNSISLRLYDSSGYRKAGEVRFLKGRFFCYEKKL